MTTDDVSFRVSLLDALDSAAVGEVSECALEATTEGLWSLSMEIPVVRVYEWSWEGALGNRRSGGYLKSMGAACEAEGIREVWGEKSGSMWLRVGTL